MAEDREILREVWEGRIPVAFSLSPDEIVNEQPDPYYYYVSIFCILTTTGYHVSHESIIN